MRQTLSPFFGRVPSRREKLVAIGVSLALLIVVGAADVSIDVPFLVGALYFLPVLVSTWFLGWMGGMALVVAATFEWAAMRAFGAAHSALDVRVGLISGLTRFSVMAEFAYLLSRSRREAFALRDALARTASLPEVIPICAWCRKFRTDDDRWQTLEQFFAEQTDVLFTHGVCGSCAERLVENARAPLEAHAAAARC